MTDEKGLVDFHSHILPGADHGSSSVETSIYQLDQAEIHGINRVIATPHFYPHRHTVGSFLKRRDDAYKALMSRYKGGVELRLGAEAMLCDGFDSLPDLDKLFIYGTKTLLLELPYDGFKVEYCDTVSKIINNGVDVILAHADRYPQENIEKLLKCGARLQLNTSPLCRIIKRRELFTWIDEKKVVALGSDIHGRDKKAYGRFVRAASKIGENISYIKAESDLVWSQSKEYL